MRGHLDLGALGPQLVYFVRGGADRGRGADPGGQCLGPGGRLVAPEPQCVDEGVHVLVEHRLQIAVQAVAECQMPVAVGLLGPGTGGGAHGGHRLGPVQQAAQARADLVSGAAHVDIGVGALSAGGAAHGAQRAHPGRGDRHLGEHCGEILRRGAEHLPVRSEREVDVVAEAVDGLSSPSAPSPLQSRSPRAPAPSRR